MAIADPASVTLLRGKRLSWPQLCAAVFVVIWLMLAWKPRYPSDWALENVLTLLAAWWLVRAYRRKPLSNTSYLLLLVFGAAHVLGSHYTYAEVPYEAWSRAWFGMGINELSGASRNHYDRLVHFLFGLLCYRPMREALADKLPRGSAAYWLAGAVMISISALYENVEWGAALVFGGDLGQAYLGTQGDVWDAHKDTALAVLGTCIAAMVSALAERRRAYATQPA